MQHHFIVSYDIGCPSRLRKVHRLMCGYGDPVQYSVFACRLGASDHAELQRRLAGLIHHGDDQVLFVKLDRVKQREAAGKLPRCETLGRKLAPTQARVIVV